MNLGPGSKVDRYRLVAPAGEGGQGSVWRAEDPLEPGRFVALKLVPTNAAPAPVLERFRREAHTLARLAHPSLPRCYALFEDLRHEVVGISLDFIEGSPLSVLLASESLTREHRVWILRHLAAALAYIHDAGLVHRDVKPQNVMIGKGFLDHPADPAGVKLVDFGIAAERNNPKPITVTGSVIGTNEFLAPEIIDRTFWKEEADGPERDVFALGVLGFSLLRGRHPAGLAGDAPIGDFMLAYRHHADDHGKHKWPEGIEGDALEGFYRASLALRASQRARNGAAMVELLSGVTGGKGGVTVHASSARDPVLGTARTEAIDITAPTATSRLAVRRSNRMIAGFVLGGAGLFAISFGIAYTRPFSALPAMPLPAPIAGTARANEQEEPPNAMSPSEVPRPSPRPGGGARPRDTGTAAYDETRRGAEKQAAPLPVSCPADMVAVAGSPAFCIDKHEVTVAEYRTCTACGAAKEAYWTGPTATDAALKEQTANCTNTRAGLDNYPVNCVAYQDAATYCAGQSKRLPRMSEWRAARSAGLSSLTFCTEMGGVCPMFEWSQDRGTQPTYRATRGPSFRYATALEGSNVEVARNDDLGFRCARDPK